MRGCVVVLVALAACGARPPPPPPPPSPPPIVVPSPDLPLTSPGPLAEVHAHLDAQLGCNDCHVNNTKAIANDKCLACHDHGDLRSRMQAGKGFHASPLVRGKPCSACHLDHRGRTFDPTGWREVGGEARFDHDNTGWQLRGVHATTACDRCHTKQDRQGLRVYMGTDRLCGACHAAASPHGSTRRDMLACERCHAEATWRPVKAAMSFNHDDRKDAAMPLVGSHRDVPCAKCHPNSRFVSGLPHPAACDNAGCHRSSHTAPIYMRDCDLCHSPTFKSMKATMFDHTERTKLDLGRHRKLACGACHATSGAVATCETCHAAKTPPPKTAQSHHGTRFAAFACETCHGTTSWSPSKFDHAKHTPMRLTGKHAMTTCRSCHRGRRPDDFEQLGPPTDCLGCHAHKKVHADDTHPSGRYTNAQCTSCHNTSSPPRLPPPFIQAVHGIDGTFPLVKKHKGVPCVDCHTRSATGRTTFGAVSAECTPACHEDSAHEGSLGAACSRCHVAGTWEALRFDHDVPFPADAKHGVPTFPLRGEHAKLPCMTCHASRDFAATPATCVGCHASDDAHQGRLGRNCGTCHVDNGNNRFAHAMTGFSLDGGHRAVPCADCHPSGAFGARPRACEGCHPVPAFHRDAVSETAIYTSNCASCHTTQAW